MTSADGKRRKPWDEYVERAEEREYIEILRGATRALQTALAEKGIASALIGGTALRLVEGLPRVSRDLDLKVMRATTGSHRVVIESVNARRGWSAREATEEDEARGFEGVVIMNERSGEQWATAIDLIPGTLGGADRAGVVEEWLCERGGVWTSEAHPRAVEDGHADWASPKAARARRLRRGVADGHARAPCRRGTPSGAEAMARASEAERRDVARGVRAGAEPELELARDDRGDERRARQGRGERRCRHALTPPRRSASAARLCPGAIIGRVRRTDGGDQARTVLRHAGTAGSETAVPALREEIHADPGKRRGDLSALPAERRRRAARRENALGRACAPPRRLPSHRRVTVPRRNPGFALDAPLTGVSPPSRESPRRSIAACSSTRPGGACVRRAGGPLANSVIKPDAAAIKRRRLGAKPWRVHQDSATEPACVHHTHRGGSVTLAEPIVLTRFSTPFCGK